MMRALILNRLAMRSGAVAILGALTLGSISASAATLGGFAVRPAQFDPREPASRAYFILRSDPGSSRDEAVVITNDASKRLVLEVNAVDGLTGVTSGVVYANRGVPVHGAGSWVTPGVRRVVVAARSTSEVHFTVRTPQSAVPGDHVAGLALQVASPTKTGGGMSVILVTRVVVGIELQVPGPSSQRIRLDSLALAPLPGTTVPSAVVTLQDVGRKLCHPQLTIAIKGQNATRSATQTLGTILPGDKIAFPFRWPGALGYGSYAVSATATQCGPEVTIRDIAVFNRASTLTAHAGVALGATAPLASRASNSTLWWLCGLIVLGAGAPALWLFLLARRRTRRDDTSLSDVPRRPKQGELGSGS